ncbi:ORF327 [White spot syndrome virus]|uniref:ORF327 n=1 Tax=White spot syndrome virus TaxID=342409 RepID=A0A2D3I661_9VIRU|nr:ORF327 [White spot syndrome virus]
MSCSLVRLLLETLHDDSRISCCSFDDGNTVEPLHVSKDMARINWNKQILCRRKVQVFWNLVEVDIVLGVFPWDRFLCL